MQQEKMLASIDSVRQIVKSHNVHYLALHNNAEIRI